MNRNKLLSIALVVSSIVLVILYISRGVVNLRKLSRRIAAEPAYTAAIVEKVGGADAVLTACQQMLETFAPADDQLYTEVSLVDSRIPHILKTLRLSCIHVRKESVFISLDEPGRIGLLAFREGSIQYGTSIITNGLWYWNGTPSKETRSAYLEEQAKVREYYKESREE